MSEHKTGGTKGIDYISLHRPWIDENGLSRVTINGYVHISSLLARLTKDEWAEMDRVALRGFTARSPVVDLFQRAGLVQNRIDGNGFNGFGEYILERQVPAGCDTSYQLEGIPLMVAWSEFGKTGVLAVREDAFRRSSALTSVYGVPLDTTVCEAAGRRVGEAVDKRIVDTLCNEATIQDGADLPAILKVATRAYSGPYALFYGDGYCKDADFEQKALANPNVNWAARAESLPRDRLLLVQMARKELRHDETPKRGYRSTATAELLINLKPTVIQCGETFVALTVMNVITVSRRETGLPIFLGGQA